jgi:hypothetical protein
MSGRNQLTIFDSPFDRDDTEYMPGTDQRIHSAFPRIHPAFDFAVAAIGLIVFAPIFLVTSLAIKLNSRGPIFIRELIVGHNNQVIQAAIIGLVRKEQRGTLSKKHLGRFSCCQRNERGHPDVAVRRLDEPLSGGVSPAQLRGTAPIPNREANYVGYNKGTARPNR